jgi:hypothetical protein
MLTLNFSQPLVYKNGVAAWFPDLIFRDVLFLRFKVLLQIDDVHQSFANWCSL